MSERTNENLTSQMEHWGYFLLPRSHPASPGYTGLLVAIRRVPTQKHFDPESLRVQFLKPSGAPEWVTLSLHTPLPKSRRVYPGAVTVCDRLGKEEEFLTFGGTIESVSVTDELVYSLRSPAPVLWLTPDGDTGPDELAAEFGRQLGELRARFAGQDELFYRRLNQIDNLSLYIAALHSILSDYEKVASLRESCPELHTLLHEEKNWLHELEQWPQNVCTLEQLLGVS